MTKLIRWEPFREMRRVHDMLDRMMDQSFLDMPFDASLREGLLPLEMYQTDDDVVVKAALPGVKSEDTHISITGDSLSIRGEMKDAHVEEEPKYYMRERRFGSFSRSLSLPTSVDADHAKANFEDGILTLILPKVEEVKAKKITVQTKR
jgi:HSP20 family protein